MLTVGDGQTFLESVRNETIPHEIVAELREMGVSFYDGMFEFCWREFTEVVNMNSGCLIVQVCDHRTATSSSSTRGAKAKSDAGSIHNFNQWTCPSPYANYPPEKLQVRNRGPPAGSTPEQKPPDAEKDEEEAKEKKTRIFTTVLHPTQMTLLADMSLLACTPMPQPTSKSGTAIQTPLTIATSAQTPTTARIPRQKMVLDDSNAMQFEAQHLLATSPALILKPTTTPQEAHRILQALKNPNHCFPLPPPKARKRTMAELQADEAQAAEQERLLLFMDDKRYNAHVSGAGAPDSAVGDGAGQPFEQNFKKFKTIEALKERMKEAKLQRQKEEEANRRKKEMDARSRVKQVNQQQVQQQAVSVQQAQAAAQQQAAQQIASAQQQQAQAQAQAQANQQAQAIAAHRAASQAGSPVLSQGSPMMAPTPVSATSAPMSMSHPAPHPSTTPRPPSAASTTAPSPVPTPAQTQAFFQNQQMVRAQALAQQQAALQNVNSPRPIPNQPIPQQQTAQGTRPQSNAAVTNYTMQMQRMAQAQAQAQAQAAAHGPTPQQIQQFQLQQQAQALARQHAQQQNQQMELNQAQAQARQMQMNQYAALQQQQAMAMGRGGVPMGQNGMPMGGMNAQMVAKGMNVMMGRGIGMMPNGVMLQPGQMQQMAAAQRQAQAQQQQQGQGQPGGGGNYMGQYAAMMGRGMGR